MILTLCACVVAAPALDAATIVKPEEIPKILILRGKNLTALKAVLSVGTTYDGGRERQDIRGFLLYRRPSDFRFQGLGPGGTPLMELVIDHKSFEMYIPSEGAILKGDKKCFGRRFPDVAELETLIPLALLQWRDAKFDKLITEDPGEVVIGLKFKDETWRATLDSRKLLLRRLERHKDGHVGLRADFGDFKSGDYGWVPRLFEVESEKAGWRSTVRISRMEVNPFLVQKNFELETTFSAKVERCK